jgi:hypothetical protein
MTEELALAASPDEDVALLADLLSLPVSERHPLSDLSPQRKKDGNGPQPLDDLSSVIEPTHMGVAGGEKATRL